MPPLRSIITPTGHTIRVDDPAQQLARCQELRAQALATPLSNEWDEQDMTTYLWHLDETEARLREKLDL